MWSYVFCSQLVSSSTAWGGAGTWVVHSILNLDHVIKINEHWWNQRSLWHLSMKIHANQAPANKIHLFMSLLWLMWWTFCEIKWFESSFEMPIHVCLFVVGLFVVRLLVHTFVWIHVNVRIRMHNQRDIGKLFHQHGFLFCDLPNLGH